MGHDRQDFIAIPTYNRLPELVACLTCLGEVRGVERCRIFVRDDASTEFDLDTLRKLAPNAERIDRNGENIGADPSQIRLFRDCIEARARRILVLDSDLILSPSALEFAAGAFARTDGLLSLYNSLAHAELRDIDEELVEKRTFGGAATFWDARLLADLLDRAEEGVRTWDWEAVAFLGASGRRIIASRRSYAQHLGISGVNNRTFGRIDYGRGFVVETESQARFMAAAFDTLLMHQEAFSPPRPAKRKTRSLVERFKRAIRMQRDLNRGRTTR
jgi:hypothetical protein